MKNQNTLVTLFFVLFAAGTRLIPHIDNFTSMEALALFGSAYYTRKYWIFIMPLITMYIVDFVINNTYARLFFPDVNGIVWFDMYMLFNWIAYILIGVLGIYMVKKVTLPRVLLSALMASVIFYIITNFGVWISPKSIYPSNIEGLLLSYTAGLPFFRTSLIGTVVFTLVLFTTFELVKRNLLNKFVFDK